MDNKIGFRHNRYVVTLLLHHTKSLNCLYRILPMLLLSRLAGLFRSVLSLPRRVRIAVASSVLISFQMWMSKSPIPTTQGTKDAVYMGIRRCSSSLLERIVVIFEETSHSMWSEQTLSRRSIGAIPDMEIFSSVIRCCWLGGMQQQQR